MKTNHRFKNDQNAQIWGDYIAIKELMVAMAINTLCGLLGYHLAPKDATSPLLFSLGGIVLATIISTFLFKPKRAIQIIQSETSKEGAV